MTKGMQYPVAVSPYGGARTREGPIVINQNIILALKPAGSLHPWNQDLAPDEDYIFDIKDNKSGGLYTLHVREFFKEMERAGHARLLPGKRGLNMFLPEDGGDMVVGVQFENLETGQIEGFRIPISGDR